MARTGHRSTDGVRQYKRDNDEQLQFLSHVAQGQLAQPERNPLKSSDINVISPTHPKPKVPEQIERAIVPVPQLESAQEKMPFSRNSLS